MQTIETKIIPATNTNPTRIRATHSGGVEAVTIGLDESDSDIESHKHAASLLLKKLKWEGDMVGGGTKVGMVWVFDEKGSPRINSWTKQRLELKEIARLGNPAAEGIAAAKRDAQCVTK